MSNTLLVNYRTYDGHLIPLDVRPDMTAKEVLQRLVPYWYRVSLSVDGHLLDGDQPLSAAGVHKGSLLSIEWSSASRHGVPIVPLYGCPTAKELPGALPACMLSEFEGFEPVQL